MRGQEEIVMFVQKSTMQTGKRLPLHVVETRMLSIATMFNIHFMALGFDHHKARIYSVGLCYNLLEANRKSLRLANHEESSCQREGMTKWFQEAIDTRQFVLKVSRGLVRILLVAYGTRMLSSSSQFLCNLGSDFKHSDGRTKFLNDSAYNVITEGWEFSIVRVLVIT